MAQGGHKGAVSEGSTGQRRRLAEPDPRPAGGRRDLAAELLDEPGLANAGCTGDQPALAVASGHNPRVVADNAFRSATRPTMGAAPAAGRAAASASVLSGGGSAAWQARGDKLVDGVRRLDVFSLCEPRCRRGCTGWRPVEPASCRRLRQHDLATMHNRRRSGPPSARPAHIAVLVPYRLTGMQPHPHPHRNPARPVMAARRHAGQRRGGGPRGMASRNTTKLYAGAHLLAATVRESGPQQGALS